jgi:hypothetical protein
MSNKSGDYREAKSDWLTTVVRFIIAFGIIFAVMVARVLVGLPEQ